MEEDTKAALQALLELMGKIDTKLNALDDRVTKLHTGVWVREVDF